MHKNDQMHQKRKFQMHQKRKFPWLAVAGSVLIFTSWVYQNLYFQSFQQKLSEMERLQNAVHIE